MTVNEAEPKTIKATATAFEIIERIGAGDSPSVSDIADDLGYSRSTVHYHLQTLVQSRHVLRDDDGYRLGLRMANLGEEAKQTHPLHGVVDDAVESLAEETDTLAFVGVEEGGKLVCLARSDGRSVDGLDVGVGREFDLHALAHGQAILSSRPLDEAEELIAPHGLAEHTDATLTSVDALGERIRTVRDIGFAYSPEEYADGVSTIAAPVVRQATDEVVGAIGVAAASDRIDDPYKQAKARRFSDELSKHVRRTARILSDSIADA